MFLCVFAVLHKNYSTDFHEMLCRGETSEEEDPGDVDPDQRADPGRDLNMLSENDSWILMKENVVSSGGCRVSVEV